MANTINILRSRGEVSHVLGPSHVVRWRKQLLDKSIVGKIHPDNLIGIGGIPIWSQSLFDKALAFSKQQFCTRIGVMVGDFRFGNQVFLSEHQVNSLLINGYSKINSDACTHEIDLKIFNHCINALNFWNHTFGDGSTYIFWCLFCREVQNRLDRKYLYNNLYVHPVWNYCEVLSKLPNLDIIDLSPLLKMPMHEVNRLFIDTSGHPSPIGYYFLDMVLARGYEVEHAYHSSVKEFEEIFILLAIELHAYANAPVIICGNSIWINALTRVLGSDGQSRLAKLGVLIIPLTSTKGRLDENHIYDLLTNQASDFLKVFSFNPIPPEELARRFNISLYKLNIEYFDWDSSANQTLQIRLARNTPTPEIKINCISKVFKLEVTDAMVELGESRSPTLLGLIMVIRQLMKFKNIT